jgi:hypothetical protein
MAPDMYNLVGEGDFAHGHHLHVQVAGEAEVHLDAMGDNLRSKVVALVEEVGLAHRSTLQEDCPW